MANILGAILSTADLDTIIVIPPATAVVPGSMSAADFTKLGLILESTYTPTAYIAVGSNLDATPTTFSCQYGRVGSFVVVSGRIDIDPTATATVTTFTLDIPVASNLANTGELAGSFGTSVLETGRLFADTTNDRATFNFVAQLATAHSLFFIFAYRVI